MLSCRKQPSLKRNLFTVRISFGTGLHRGVVRMLTLTALCFPLSSPFPFLFLFFFLLSLYPFLSILSHPVSTLPHVHFCFSSRPGRPPKRTQSVTSPENPHIMPHSVPGLMSPGMIPPTGNTHGPCILSGIPLVIC